MAAVTLFGTGGLAFAATVKAGDDLRVQAGSASANPVFKGEVVGVEPIYDPANPHVVIRGYNRIHRLAGEPQTRLFADVTDADIVTALAHAHGLVPAPAPELVERYETVFQHNQTDLEFLRARAARIGFQVWCEDTTLFFRKATAARPFVVGAALRADAPLRRFHPRLATSDSVQRVTVQGWDPVRSRDIVGEATAATRALWPEPNQPDLVLGRTAAYTVDRPIFSATEARAIAAETLAELLTSAFDAEAEIGGSAALRPGRLVAVQGVHERFDGKYFVRGVSHRYSHGDGCGSQGYRTLLRLEHAAPVLFFLPDVNDEVLVAFEQGDLARPYVVGSLWGSDDGDDDGCSTEDPPRD